MGDESAQEYTQLNAFLLCVSDFGWQWGQWSQGDNGGHWWQLAECIQPAQWIPVRFPQVSASSFPRGSLKQQAEAGGGLGDSLRWFLQGGSRWVLAVAGYVGYFVPNLIFTYVAEWVPVASYCRLLPDNLESEHLNIHLCVCVHSQKRGFVNFSKLCTKIREAVGNFNKETELRHWLECCISSTCIICYVLCPELYNSDASLPPRMRVINKSSSLLKQNKKIQTWICCLSAMLDIW